MKMTDAMFLKLVKDLGACSDGIRRFEGIKAPSLKRRLTLLKEAGFQGDWYWLYNEVTRNCPKTCPICKPKVKKARSILFKYMKRVGLLG